MTSFPSRRYDLDWLRVILFGILVPYHALIGFVSYGHSVYGYRNPDVGGDLAEFTVFAFHAWRLPALFFISGVGTYFVIRNKGLGAFVQNRAIRLLIPLIVGVVFWNAVTSYYIVTAAGQDWTFPTYFWHRLQNLTIRSQSHLWFLVNLFLYSVGSIPLMLWMVKGGSAARRIVPILAFLSILMGIFLVKPYDETIYSLSWTACVYWSYYIIGFWFMTLPNAVWIHLSNLRWAILIAALSTLALLGAILGALSDNTDRMNLIIQGGWAYSDLSIPMLTSAGYSILYAINTALWCCAIFAFGHRHLNHSTPLLAHLNRAVYPFYIFHFPVLMVGLFYLRYPSWPWFIEFLLLTAFTFTGTAFIVWIFDKLPPMRLLVGLSSRKSN